MLLQLLLLGPQTIISNMLKVAGSVEVLTSHVLFCVVTTLCHGNSILKTEKINKLVKIKSTLLSLQRMYKIQDPSKKKLTETQLSLRRIVSAFPAVVLYAMTKYGDRIMRPVPVAKMRNDGYARFPPNLRISAVFFCLPEGGAHEAVVKASLHHLLCELHIIKKNMPANPMGCCVKFAKMAYESELIPQKLRVVIFNKYIMTILMKVPEIKKALAEWIRAFDGANRRYINVHSERFGQTGKGTKEYKEPEEVPADLEGDAECNGGRVG